MSHHDRRTMLQRAIAQLTEALNDPAIDVRSITVQTYYGHGAVHNASGMLQMVDDGERTIQLELVVRDTRIKPPIGWGSS